MIRDIGGAAFPFAVDLADSATIRTIFAAIAEQFGAIDIMVNNAGSAPTIKTMQWVPDDQWDKTVSVNLTAVYAAVKAVLPAMLPRGDGVIVTVSSLAAIARTCSAAPPTGRPRRRC